MIFSYTKKNYLVDGSVSKDVFGELDFSSQFVNGSSLVTNKFAHAWQFQTWKISLNLLQNCLFKKLLLLKMKSNRIVKFYKFSFKITKFFFFKTKKILGRLCDGCDLFLGFDHFAWNGHFVLGLVLVSILNSSIGNQFNGFLDQFSSGPTVSNTRYFGLRHEKNFVDGKGKNLAVQNSNNLKCVSDRGDGAHLVTNGGGTMNTFGSVLRSDKKKENSLKENKCWSTYVTSDGKWDIIVKWAQKREKKCNSQ